jgi:RNA polymerase sigma-54 factor
MLLQRQTPALRSLATAHLAQTMTLLHLNADELSQKVESALAANPALELLPERRCRTCGRVILPGAPCPVCSRLERPGSDAPIIFVSPTPTRCGSLTPDDIPADNQPAVCESLAEYVLRQIAPDLTAAQRPLAAHLLTHLNEDGLLETSVLEVARYHHVPPSQVEAVLRLIQHADPLGVGSASAEDALCLQLSVLAETRRVPPLAERAIRQGLGLLSRRRYADLGQLLGISLAQAEAIAQFISDNLNPFPGRSHWGDVCSGSPALPTYRNPDAIISQPPHDPTGPLLVEVFSPFAGRLRINPLFRQAVLQAEGEQNAQWRADLEQATLLIKCLAQRQQAIVRLLALLATCQRAFILHGEGALKPLTRARLAAELDVHESTISRAVADKAVQLPNGRIIPLARFFDRSLPARLALKRLIEQGGSQLTDSELAQQLAHQGYRVARRTVAKYRAQEGILPVHLRQPT